MHGLRNSVVANNLIYCKDISAVVECGEQLYVIPKDWLSFGINIALIKKQLISIWKDPLCYGASSCAHLVMQPTLYFKMNE